MSEPNTNSILAEILTELQAQTLFLVKPYESVINTGVLNVIDGASVGRAGNELAVKTVIQNLGAQNVWIYEDDSLVAILPAGQAWESFGGGTGAISLITKLGTGLTSTALVTTYLAASADSEEDPETVTVGNGVGGTLILAEQSEARIVSIANNGSVAVTISDGGTPTAGVGTAVIQPGGYWERPAVETSAIRGITASGTAQVTVTIY